MNKFKIENIKKNEWKLRTINKQTKNDSNLLFTSLWRKKNFHFFYPRTKDFYYFSFFSSIDHSDDDYILWYNNDFSFSFSLIIKNVTQLNQTWLYLEEWCLHQWCMMHARVCMFSFTLYRNVEQDWDLSVNMVCWFFFHYKMIFTLYHHHIIFSTLLIFTMLPVPA